MKVGFFVVKDLRDEFEKCGFAYYNACRLLKFFQQ